MYSKLYLSANTYFVNRILYDWISFSVCSEENLLENKGRNVTMAPLFHACGLTVLLLSIKRNQTLVVMRGHDRRRYLSALQEYEVGDYKIYNTNIDFRNQN